MSETAHMGRFIPEYFNKAGPATMPMVCRNFRPLRKNTLLGFAEVHIRELDMTMKDIAIHEKNGSRWAAPPARPQFSKDGAVIRDDAGKIAYSPIIEFPSRASRDRFSQQVIDAVLVRAPGVFAETDEPCF
jgi:hypothetical protein